uniref:Uncharacterized protein n=1 Tax=Eutreptiella gymnastica TaxID=73025 RepID=A0A7S1I0R3_9EUGL|mmetsp:Transcript_119367/g.207786  ORF Transcript_119367/g.207786 Transcript_119367/m.207786 type:complete len:460 (+) Transcript_119367:63-1442(+)
MWRVPSKRANPQAPSPVPRAPHTLRFGHGTAPVVIGHAWPPGWGAATQPAVSPGSSFPQVPQGRLQGAVGELVPGAAYGHWPQRDGSLQGHASSLPAQPLQPAPPAQPGLTVPNAHLLEPTSRGHGAAADAANVFFAEDSASQATDSFDAGPALPTPRPPAVEGSPSMHLFAGHVRPKQRPAAVQMADHPHWPLSLAGPTRAGPGSIHDEDSIESVWSSDGLTEGSAPAQPKANRFHFPAEHSEEEGGGVKAMPWACPRPSPTVAVASRRQLRVSSDGSRRDSVAGVARAAPSSRSRLGTAQDPKDPAAPIKSKKGGDCTARTATAASPGTRARGDEVELLTINLTIEGTKELSQDPIVYFSDEEAPARKRMAAGPGPKPRAKNSKAGFKGRGPGADGQRGIRQFCMRNTPVGGGGAGKLADKPTARQTTFDQFPAFARFAHRASHLEIIASETGRMMT